MSTQFVSRFVLPFVLCLVGACGAGSYGPKAVCKPELNAQNLPTTKSLDCGDDACIKVDYNKSASETAMICAPIDALCATIAPTCAMAGKVCKLINGVPTCDFETPVDPCAGYTMCASGTVCKANTNGQPYCDRVSGFPEGASCKVDAECASMKCVSMKCVATCKADAECATTEWCDSKTNTCQPDLQDGQTVCDRNAQCINGNCDVASGKCLPPVSGTCATDSQCSDAKWCDSKTNTCVNDLPNTGGPCNRNAQCASGYCAPNNTCQPVPPVGNCASHTLTVPASITEFGAASGPLQGTERSFFAIAADGKSATDTGRKISAPAGSWIARTPGAQITFCPDAEDLMLNARETGQYVVGGFKNGSVCQVNVEPTLLAKIMGAITKTNSVEITAAAACDVNCGCNLFIFRK